MQALPRRQQEVLQATVRHYVDTMEPVGSSILVRRFGLPASPATVRSAMGALELKGLLTQPHPSAGRVPSPKGYRHYVDCLLPAPGAAAQQLERELAELSLQWSAFEDLLHHLARRLAEVHERLRRARDTAPLFDSARTAGELDALYLRMAERSRAGLRPAALPPLRAKGAATGEDPGR